MPENVVAASPTVAPPPQDMTSDQPVGVLFDVLLRARANQGPVAKGNAVYQQRLDDFWETMLKEVPPDWGQIETRPWIKDYANHWAEHFERTRTLAWQKLTGLENESWDNHFLAFDIPSLQAHCRVPLAAAAAVLLLDVDKQRVIEKTYPSSHGSPSRLAAAMQGRWKGVLDSLMTLAPQAVAVTIASPDPSVPTTVSAAEVAVAVLAQALPTLAPEVKSQALTSLGAYLDQLPKPDLVVHLTDQVGRYASADNVASLLPVFDRRAPQATQQALQLFVERLNGAPQESIQMFPLSLRRLIKPILTPDPEPTPAAAARPKP